MTLYKLLREGTTFVWLIPKLQRVWIEEWAFRFNSSLTTTIIFILTTVLGAKQYIGPFIQCLPIDNTAMNADFMNTYCLIQSTFTVPFDTIRGGEGTKAVNTVQVPGGAEPFEGNLRLHHNYYLWSPFFLFFLAVFFYVPHGIWKTVENHKLRGLLQNLITRDIKILAEKQTSQLELLGKYLWRSRGHHKAWASVYLFCEILNFAIVLMSMYVTNIFLKGEFSAYGLRAYQFIGEDPEDRQDPMSLVFPTLTKCQFKRYGAGGDIESFDTMCVLTGNIWNEKVFVFLWFWFVALALLSCANLVTRLATLLSLQIRLNKLKMSLKTGKNSPVVRMMQKLCVTDWILLRLLRINLRKDIFNKLMLNLIHEMENGLGTKKV